MDFSNVSQGMRAKVIAIRPGSILVKRLQEMGLTVGTEFTVVKVAPFGDPIEIQMRGYRLCLRKHETSDIVIEALEN